MLGYEAVIAVLDAKPEDDPIVVGTRANRIIRIPLMESVERTRQVAAATEAVRAFGTAFRERSMLALDDLETVAALREMLA